MDDSGAVHVAQRVGERAQHPAHQRLLAEGIDALGIARHHPAAAGPFDDHHRLAQAAAGRCRPVDDFPIDHAQNVGALDAPRRAQGFLAQAELPRADQGHERPRGAARIDGRDRRRLRRGELGQGGAGADFIAVGQAHAPRIPGRAPRCVPGRLPGGFPRCFPGRLAGRGDPDRGFRVHARDSGPAPCRARPQ